MVSKDLAGYLKTIGRAGGKTVMEPMPMGRRERWRSSPTRLGTSSGW